MKKGNERQKKAKKKNVNSKQKKRERGLDKESTRGKDVDGMVRVHTARKTVQYFSRSIQRQQERGIEGGCERSEQKSNLSSNCEGF